MQMGTQHFYDERVLLDYKLTILKNKVGEKNLFEFTYLVPNDCGTGSKCISYSGYVQKVNDNRTIILTDGTVIEISQIVRIDSKIFED